MRTIWREGRHALLAIFCLSTGIALLVSLQTLGLVLRDSLAVSGQMLIGADLIVSDIDHRLDTHAEQPFAAWRTRGDLVDYTTLSTPQVSVKKGDQATIIETRVVDPDKFPLYGEVPFLTPAGTSLSDLIRDPEHIVVNEQLVKRLPLSVGDEVQLGKARVRTFRVAGIIPSRTTRPMMFDTAAMLGVGYLSRQAAARILPDSERETSNQFLIKTASAEQSAALAPRIQAISKSYQVQVAEKELARSVDQIKGLSTFFLYVALLALLTSGVAIADTMLATVSRRQDEIAILKTLGADGRDLVLLFTFEAALRGLIGSVLGIALGTALGFGLQTFAEEFIGQPLAWRVYPDPILHALFIGPLAAVAFSLLPTLTASGIRPIRLIRRQVGRQPRRMYVIIPAIVLLTAGIMGLLAGALTGNLAQGESMAGGALVILLLLVLVFWFLLWMAECLLRMIGRLWLDLMLAVRGLSRRRLRSAITLTTLTIGVFAIAMITILAAYARQAVVEQMDRELGYNLIVFFPRPQADRDEMALLLSAPGLVQLSAGNQAQSELVRVNNTAAKALIDEHRSDLQKEYSYGAWRTIQGRDLAVGLPEVIIKEGRSLTIDDTGKRVLLIPEGLASALGLKCADRLALTVANVPVSFAVVGIYKRPEMSIGGAGFITSKETLEKVASQASGLYRLQIREEDLDTATQRLGAHLPGSLVLNTRDVLLAMTNLLDRVALLPVLIAGLTLLVGSVMVANSVGLVTVQRYEEIGILKALGATGARIFVLIWLENNIIGLLGAAIGVGLALWGAAQLGPEIFDQSISLESLDPIGIVIPILAALLVTSIATALAVWPTVNLRPAAALRNE
jgi:putative ABC transport system permease protein